jgi:formate-dependent nitrite reductase membrane component NrfD
VALFCNALTGVLLIADLKRPERWHYLLARGRFDSWLVRGAFILLAHAAFCVLIVAMTWMWDPGSLRVLAWPGIAIGAATAGYTAFLFAQAEGRDLWQSPIVLLHLLADALVCGAAVLLIIDILVFDRETSAALTMLLGSGLAALCAVIAVDAVLPHRTPEGALGHARLTRGPRAIEHWGAVAGGAVLPLVLLVVTRAWTGAMWPAGLAASALALAWLPVRANAFIRAGQEVPLS